MAVLGIIWTQKNKKQVIVAGAIVGMYLFLFGMIAFILLEESQVLIVDSICGFLTLIFGYITYKELKK
jgi:zinc transporter ZupT